ncbi:MADS box transcription factor, partial [Volvox carteri f. nagariensis]
MDLFETLGLGPRQPEENEVYIAIYEDPVDSAATAAIDAAATAPRDGGSGGGGGGSDDANGDSKAAARTAPYGDDSAPCSSSAEGGGTGGQPSGTSGGSAADGGREGCVWAVVRFGDAVDDEWWLVWLLLRMSRDLQNLSVQVVWVWDNDGQFLLIEAAYALPRWLKPEISDNRVWLRRGQMHIIPLPSTAAPDLPASPTVAQALAVLREARFATASLRVQRPIDQRLEGYPARARREQQQVARCLLPGPVAAALQAEPQLVSQLVEAFYLRDADDMRAAARMRFLPAALERSPVLVRMTRCHYAQLAAQRFSAPRGLAMPPPDSPLAKAADLGLKLTVAAEILCARHAPAVLQQQKQKQGNGEAEAAGTGAQSEAHFAGNPCWGRFKASLESNGYFQGHIPGSRRYKELLAAALEIYAAGLTAEGDDGSSSGSSMPQSCGGGVALLRDPGGRLAEAVLGKVADSGRVEKAT